MKTIHNSLILDKKDKYLLKKYSFYLVGGLGNKYPATEIKNKTVYLHHLILMKKKGFEIDHINRNVYDNRRSNLRYVTSSQNGMNRGMMKNNTSGFRGVGWHNGKWQARIRIQGKLIHLGHFSDIEEAAMVYKNKAVELFEEYLGEIN